MPKAAPLFRAFNAGEFSELLDGRVDLDRYSASLHSMLNVVATPQGPAVSRSGTKFEAPNANTSQYSALVPFVFSEEQSLAVEVSPSAIRFLDEEGVLTYAPTTAGASSTTGLNVQFNVAGGEPIEAGDQVVFAGFPEETGINGELVTVATKIGDEMTAVLPYLLDTNSTGTVAKVYAVPSGFSVDQLRGLRYNQSVDVLYLTSDRRPLKLTRFDTYDWRLEEIEFVDGPYEDTNETRTTLTPSATGNAVPFLTQNLTGPIAATSSSNEGENLRFTAAGLDAAVGELVLLDGYTDEGSFLNGRAVEVLSVVGSTYVVDVEYPTAPVVDPPEPYTVPDGFVSRYGAGASTVRPDVQGTNETPVSFLGRDLTYSMPDASSYLAFDDDADATYWASAQSQSGFIMYRTATPFVCDGYTVRVPRDNQDPNYVALDYAPSSFTFEAFDGTDWIVLDEREDYVLYEGGKSIFFEIDNETAFEAYRLNVSKLRRNGLIEARVSGLTLRDVAAADITFTASQTDGINKGTGFVSTDVDRLMRVRASDGVWRPLKITAVVNTTTVRAKLMGEPFPNLKPMKSWRLGLWSDTTGWPDMVEFLDDKLWFGGTRSYPDTFAASVSQDYENMAPTDLFGVVLDDSAFVRTLNARKLSRIRWMKSDLKGMLIGTGYQEFMVSSTDGGGITVRNARARPAAFRGSKSVEPVQIDDQVLFVQRGGRALRELAFVFEADGYKAPSMSQLASHLGAKTFAEVVYSAEPHSILWVRRDDGSLVGLTYNRDENVIGWHRHDLSGGVVESMAVVPQKDELQDALWLTVRRFINGRNVRYIERLMPFWDFGDDISDAHFEDSGLRYEGSPSSVIYGLRHLEGEEVYGHADLYPVGPLIVKDGKVDLGFEASDVLLGLGFESEGVLQRVEAGSADGTAQGKPKRMHSAGLNVWSSYGGELGVYNEERDEIIYERLDYPVDFSETEKPALHTGFLPPVNPAPGYGPDGRLAFRRPKDSPFPFNVIALTPKLHTQDG